MKNIVQNLPQKPGIYKFKDDGGNVIYIGKAKNLRKRVSSYFSKSHQDRPWTNILVGLIKDVETIVVNNETEALMLEATLIKDYRPRFNILMTDDKAYPYIKLTVKEEFPRTQVVRKRINDGSRYFGPYLSARSSNYACEFIRRVYGIHQSNHTLRTGQDRPCLNCQLEGNSCPLADEISAEAYNKQIEKAVYFLEGKRKGLLKDLKERMEQASERHQFELAAKFRDQVRGIESVLGRQHVISGTGDDIDIIGTAKTESKICLALVRVIDGQVRQSYHLLFSLNYGQTVEEVIRQFLLTIYFNTPAIPPLVVIPTEVDDQDDIEDFLENARGAGIELRSAKRGEKLDLINLANKNAQSYLEQHLLKTDQGFASLIALKELLGLPELPGRIEAVDISNLGSSEAVGATACFINGQPDKNEYRRYKIKTVEGQNDFAMIKEVTLRRFNDVTRPIPELFVVDGGIEQLGFAQKALSESLIQPKNIIALAKNPDRVFLPGRKLPIKTSRGNKGLLLLSRIRDEVHRFGISFQRQRQRKKSLGRLS